jgi:lysophospholipase L1-like esterase
LKRPVIISSLILNIFFLGIALAVIDRKGGCTWVMDKAAGLFHAQSQIGYAENKNNIFGKLPPIERGDTVFLGDSILDYGEWHEWLGNHAKNRAVNGDDTRDILKRLHVITKGKPHHIVLLIGLNNLENDAPLKTVMSEYAEIVNRIRKESPGTDIWLLSLSPVNRALYRRHIIPGHAGIHMPESEDINNLNNYMKKIATGQVHYIDLKELLSPAGELSGDYTLDGEHLNGAGLEIIARKLRQLILH